MAVRSVSVGDANSRVTSWIRTRRCDDLPFCVEVPGEYLGSGFGNPIALLFERWQPRQIDLTGGHLVDSESGPRRLHRLRVDWHNDA